MRCSPTGRRWLWPFWLPPLLDGRSPPDSPWLTPHSGSCRWGWMFGNAIPRGVLVDESGTAARRGCRSPVIGWCTGPSPQQFDRCHPRSPTRAIVSCRRSQRRLVLETALECDTTSPLATPLLLKGHHRPSLTPSRRRHAPGSPTAHDCRSCRTNPRSDRDSSLLATAGNRTSKLPAGAPCRVPPR